MLLPRKLLALTTGALIAVSAPFLATATQAQQAAEGETLLVDDATFEFIQKSDISALTEGVLEKLELEIGKNVQKSGVIGTLHKQKAELLVAKAKTAATSTGAIQKAKAQYEQAIASLARNKRLRSMQGGHVSQEDYEKSLAEVAVTEAMIQEAEENQKLAQAELALATQARDEHTIKAPFSGVILKVLKREGESVKANEPVVELGNLEKVRVFFFVPLETSFRLSEGDEVEWQLTVHGKRGNVLPIEQKKFRGVISFIDPQVQPQVATEVRIYADFKNDNFELRPGMKGTLTLRLNAPGAKPRRVAATAVEPAAIPAVANTPVQPPSLPPLSNTSDPATRPSATELPTLPRN